MEKKTQGIILFLIVIIYWILWRIFYEFITTTLNILLWIIWIVIIIFFIYWLNKNTDFFKKIPLKERPEHRFGVAEELGFISVAIYVGYFLGFLLIGLGIFSLFLNRPDKLDSFLGATILGLIIIMIMFFVNRSRRKKQA